MNIARDGSLLVADANFHRLVRITNPLGLNNTPPQATLVAGRRSTFLGVTYTADGQNPVDSPLCNVRDVNNFADGTVVWAEDCTAVQQGVLIRRIRTNPITGLPTIETLAGTNANGAGISSACNSGTCVASQQPIANTSLRFGIGIDGSIYFSDSTFAPLPCATWRVTTDGILHLVTGGSSCGNTGDGGPAISATTQGRPGVSVDGTALLLTDVGNNVVRRVTGDGTITRVAGNTGGGAVISGNPALSTPMTLNSSLSSVAVRSPDGFLYVATTVINTGQSTLVRFGAPPTGAPGSNGHSLVLSEDGTELFDFDASGRHVATRTPERGATRYTFGYDGNNRLTTVTDAFNNVVNLSYGANTVSIYDARNPANYTTLNLDSTTHYLASVVNAHNDPYSMTYFPNQPGMLQTFTPPNNQMHSFTYTSTGLLVKDVSPISGSAGTQLSSSNTATARVVDLITPEGRDTRHSISYAASTAQNGNGATLIESRTHTDPVGLVTTDNTYSDTSHTITYPDSSALTTTFTSDPRFGFDAPRLASSTFTTGSGNNQRSITTSVAYGAPQLSNLNDPTSLTGEVDTYTVNGKTFTRAFNALTSPATVTITTPLNRTITTQLDSFDRPNQISIAGNVPGTSGPLYPVTMNPALAPYADRIGTIAQNLQSLTASYGSNRLTSLASNAYGTTSMSSFDAIDRPHSSSIPGPLSVGVDYDSDGNVKMVQPPAGAGSTHNFAFNAVDYLASYTPPGASATGIGYTPDSLFSYMAMPGGVRYRTYDGAGRVQNESYPNPQGGANINTTWSYSPATGHVSTLNNADVNLTYTYDGVQELAEQYVVAGKTLTVNKTYAVYPPLALSTMSVTGTNGSTSVTYCYDDDGAPSGIAALSDTCASPTMSVTRGPNGMISGITMKGGMTETLSYNRYGSLLDHTLVSGGYTVYEETYTRDLNPSADDQRIHTKTETIRSIGQCTQTYTYDAANRLASNSASGTGGCPGAGTFGYDNASPGTVVAGDGNVNGYSYNAQDQLGSGQGWTWTYDANGAVSKQTAGSTLIGYTYDVLGNLRHFTRNDAYSRYYDFKIDGRNRRVARYLSGNFDHGWLYSGSQVVGEFDANGNVYSVFAYLTKSNVPDLMIKSGIVYRLVSDTIGTMKAVVQPGLSTTADAYTYADAWGSPNGQPSMQPFGFAGGLAEYYTGSYRFGARDYSPWQRHWFSRDPILFDGGLNLYGYCDDDPINCIDPSGLETQVIRWDPAGLGGSSFGHISVRINDTSYSWGPGNGGRMDVEPWADYAAKQAFRNGTGYVLNLSEAEESDLAKRLHDYTGTYSAITNNCGAPLQSALSNGRPYDHYLLPRSLITSLVVDGRVTGLTSYSARDPSWTHGVGLGDYVSSHSVWTWFL